MQWLGSIITLVASATLVVAVPAGGPGSPDQGGQSYHMVNAKSKHNDMVTVGDYSKDDRGRVAREELSIVMRSTPVPNCKGSSYCSNSQNFKNDCAAAQNSLQPTTYTSGGDKAGVCSGSCGLFVQGSKGANGRPCAVLGTDLYNGFNSILGNGCETCGSVAAPAGGDCIITVNYVAGCTA